MVVLLCLSQVPSALASFKINLSITGLPGTLSKTAYQTLEARIVQARQQGELNLAQAPHLHAQLADTLRTWLATQGYFNSHVHTQLRTAKQQAYSHYQVKLGRPLRVHTLRVELRGEGQHNRDLKQALHTLALQPGQPFISQHYTDCKTQLLTAALNQGFPLAHFSRSEAQIDLKHQRAYVVFILDTGPALRFGPVTFIQAGFDPQFLARFVPFKIGDPYQAQALQTLQQNLTNSRFFNSVELDPKLPASGDPAPPQHRVPITVHLTPKKAKQYRLGAGYGTDTGPRGVIGVNLRRLTRSGQQFDALLNASQVHSKLGIEYLIPGLNPVTDRLSFTLLLEHEESQKLGQSTNSGWVVAYDSAWHDWQQTLALHIMNAYSKLPDQPKSTSFLIYPSLSWLKQVTDHMLRPNRGYRMHFQLLGTRKNPWSTLSFWQANTDLRALMPLFWGTRLLLHTQIGLTRTGDFTRFPLSLKFRAGGARSLRGFSYKSLGPGKQLLLGSLEFQHRLYKQLYLAAFADCGSVSQRLGRPLETAVGAGLVWESPIGALKLTAAHALSQANHPWLVQFSMGPEL